MSFFDAIKAGFAGYIKFDGRSTRSEFWYFMLFLLIGTIVASLHPAAGLLFMAATFLPNLAVSIRRLHDINKSGFWLLIALTGIGVFLLIFWWCQKSDQIDNAFGSVQA